MIRYSPAKVNLYLKVLRRRKDGYHDIASLMQRVSLCDEMEFILKGRRDVIVRCPGTELPQDEENIAGRAARALLNRAGSPAGVEITIRKNIPAAAGLGGGSSNAATTLVTLNEMMRLGFSNRELMEMGAKIGADVPFFVFGRTAWAFGIGERLQAVEGIPGLWYVLLNPGFGISTRMVYEGLNFALTKDAIPFSIPFFQTIGDIAEGLQNDLEAVAFRLHPDLIELKQVLMEHGALGSLMSGSGATVFGIFPDEKGARQVCKALARAGRWSAHAVHSL